MPKFSPITCIGVESDQEVDPIALGQAIDTLCHWAIQEYFSRHPNLPPPGVREVPATPRVEHAKPTTSA
jgi:hypothetical protein